MKPNTLRKKFHNQAGATLLELMMIVAIIGLLGFTFVDSAPDRMVSAQWSDMQVEVEHIKLAIGTCVTASLGVTADCDGPAKLYAQTGYAVRPEFNGNTVGIEPATAALVVTIAKKDGACTVVVTPDFNGERTHWTMKRIGKNCNNLSTAQSI